MARLEAGDTVRVLFYGQSISKQAWWREVARDLAARFPRAKLTIENRAIGGYSTPRLIRTMEADILPFHPDLIVFHDYGPEDLYEKMIRWMRSHTTADILLQSDHVVWLPGEEDRDGSRKKSYDFQERHSFEWMPELARKYGLGVVDIRGGWHKHLKESELAPKALLRDSVHLNEAGAKLYAALTKQYLVKAGAAGALYYKDFAPRFRKGEARLPFEGTRVELIDGSDGPLDVLIDGKRPAEDPSLYYHSRPTNTWGADWPTVMRIGRGEGAAFPWVEEWILKVTKKREPTGLRFDFAVFGSRTGPDGEGANDEAFRSRSGRVTIAPDDYDVERAYGLQKQNMPNDWQVRWATLPRFVDPYLPAEGGTTVLFGLRPGKHELRLRGRGRVRKIRVYRPGMLE